MLNGTSFNESSSGSSRDTPMTLERLARLMKCGFEGMDYKFDTLRQDVQREIEKLAVMTANECAAVRGEMAEMRTETATKVELREIARGLAQNIDRVDTHLSAIATQWRDDYDGVHNTTKDHEGRLRILEKREKLA